MTDKAKEDLLRRSEILKDTANVLFEGEESIRCVYGLLHAASEIIKESRKKDYKDAVVEAAAILSHLEHCTGCVTEGWEDDEAMTVKVPYDEIDPNDYETYSSFKSAKERATR